VPLFHFSGKCPPDLGVFDGRLTGCPATPNCVCSDATDKDHRIEALVLAVSPNQAWPAVRRALSTLPRVHIVTDGADYLHAQCESVIFGFVDDLELHLRSREGVIAVRSASRLGHSDLGANRRRVERIRAILARLGVVR
jgi:uncharacterized protein (DUF1499 family)